MRVIGLLLLVVLLCGVAFTATTTALEPLTAAVDARLAAIDGDTARERRDRRVLEKLAETLAEPTTSLAGDLDLARRATRRINRGLPRDAELKSLAADAVAEMQTLAVADRMDLGRWAGRLADPLTEPWFAGALAAVDRKLTRADDAPRVATRAQHLVIACLRMDETRVALGLYGDPPPLPGPMPDFTLPDVNPASLTFNEQVSPRDYLDKVSAWYFGHAG